MVRLILFLKNNIQKISVFRHFIRTVKNNFIFRALVLKCEYQFKNKFYEIDFSILDNLNIRTYVDVGAHVGRYINFLKIRSENIIAFEPLKYSFKILNLIFLYKKINLFNLALGNIHMNSFINYSKVFNKNNEELLSSMAEASINNQFQNNKIDKIKIVRGDSILNKYSDVDLIKIDTEGYEFQVLQGLSKTVKNNLPILLIEIEKRHSKNFLQTFLFLKKNNYKLYYCNELYSLKLLNFKNINNFIKKNQTLQKLKSSSKISDWKKPPKTYNKYICNFWFVHPHSRLSSELQRFIS